MPYCPSCNNELSERALYCASCGVQAKCKACRDILDLKAHFCVSCGTPVGEGSSIHPERASRPDRVLSHNIIEFSEDAKSRHFHAEVSDAAVDSVSQSLGIFLSQRIGKPVSRVQRQTSNLDEVIVDGTDDIKDYEDDPHPIIEGAKALPVGSDLEILQRIFRRTGNKLELEDSRLKQNSQQDFVRRLTVLFLFAHELYGQQTVPRTDLNAILTKAKVYDSNSRQWIRDTDFITVDGDSVRLISRGREHAQKVINECLDPQKETTWSSQSKSRRRSSKGHSDEKEGEAEGGKARKGRRAKAESYTAQVKGLFERDFFAEGHTSKEVLAELERAGYTFEPRRINEVLLNLTKKGKLSRKQNESKVWVYKSG